MSLRARDLGQADFLAYRALTLNAFGGRETETENRPFTPGQSVIGIDSSSLPGGIDGVIAAGARIRHDEITLAGGVALSGGVAGLAVHPAHRGGGLFDEIVRAVVSRCQTDGMAFSMLFPSNASIYRRHGFQNVMEQWEVIVPLQDLVRLRPSPDLRLVPVTEKTMPRVRALYRELTAQENGMLLRTGPLFPTTLPGDGWSALLLEDEHGQDRGYLSCTRTSGQGEATGLVVHEVLGRSRADLVALLASLGSWSTVLDQVRIRLRTEDPLRDVIPSGHLSPASGDREVVQMRVIDTVKALSARPAPDRLHGGIILEITDDSLSAGLCEAAGRFRVSAEDGVTTAVRLSPNDSGGEPRTPTNNNGALGTVRLDIHAASLLLIGGRSLADARRLLLHAEADPDAEAWFDALVAGPRPAILDAF